MTASSLTQERLTLGRVVERAAARYGSLSAIEDGDTRFDYTELWQRALEAARAFIAAGLEPGDRVAIWAPNLWQWIVSAVGLESIGGVLVPINTRFKGSEARHVLEKSRARFLFTVEEFLGQRYVDMLRAEPVLPALERIVLFQGRAADAQDFSEFLKASERVPPARAVERIAGVSPDDPLDMLFTSGTTGKPKGVVTTHAQNLRVFDVWSEVVGLTEEDRYLIVNPFFHAFGYKAGWLASILRGATILPHAVFDVPAVLERIGRERISVLPGPPTLYQSILAHPERGRYDLSCLRLAVTGAAAIPVSLIERMRSELSFDTVLTAYGLTETCGVVSMCRRDDDAQTIATTSGRAIPGVEVRLVGDDGAEVPRGAPGEIVVRGYNVMQGYFEDEAGTREAIDEHGWLRTGDIGVMDERENLRITDRKKDMFIAGGFNCYPAEIESLMLEQPGIAQVAVVGMPDERLGEVGMAFVLLAPGSTLTSDEINGHCRARMANYKVPRRVEIVDRLPTNATGKVTKFVLRERARELASKASS